MDALDKLAFKKKIAISWVSIWETEILERKGRIKLNPDLDTWLKMATDSEFCSVLAADVDLVLAQRNLPDNFHADPADLLIVATSILSGFSLITKDQKIIDSGACKIREI